MTNNSVPEPSIRDIPTIKKTIQGIKSVTALKKVMPLARPLFRLLGIDVAKIDESLTQVDELEQMVEDLASIPDKFNDFFAERGWIIYGLMNVEVAKSAVCKAEEGDLEAAEQILVEYYDVATVRWQLLTMNGVAAFRPRMLLAEKALLDYVAERYYASILVVLSLLDGLVNDLHLPKQSFFSAEVNLEAWDSFAGHSKGLQALVKVLQKGRYKTRTESISIPYRNGIMHGLDLGYDNKMVAAKAWAALFATREWAMKAEQGTLTPQPEEPQVSWGQLWKQLKDNAKNKKLLEEWTPREIRTGKDVPVTGEPGDYGDNTPEKKLAEYLTYRKRRNYGYMAKCLSVLNQRPNSSLAGIAKEVFHTKLLRSFEFVEIDDQAAAITEIEALLVYEESDVESKKAVRFRLICEDSVGSPVIRGKADGTWALIKWGIF